VVEDDIPLGKFLSREIKLKNSSVQVSNDGELACEMIKENAYDLVILDLNLPGLDGMAILKRVRQLHLNLPILVLTARNRTEDLVSALDQGADDYLIKPFSLKELQARTQSLLRRHSAPDVSTAKVCNLVINREEHWVRRGERRINLTAREFDILDYLMNNAGKAVSRTSLMQDVWKIPFDPSTNIVDVYMKYLRDKVDIDGEEKLIRTVRGVGYVLSVG
jgi:DNA-binding response OmpR family regulator